MVTNDVVEKSNKLVHGRYKEHYQFVQLDGSKFDYKLTQRFQNKPNLSPLQAPSQIYKSESGHLGDSLEMDSKKIKFEKSMKLFDLKFCLISVTDHDIDHFMQDLLYSFVLF